jgi:hypothetical protein
MTMRLRKLAVEANDAGGISEVGNDVCDAVVEIAQAAIQILEGTDAGRAQLRVDAVVALLKELTA